VRGGHALVANGHASVGQPGQRSLDLAAVRPSRILTYPRRGIRRGAKRLARSGDSAEADAAQ
jgi:hypothetical protein